MMLYISVVSTSSSHSEGGFFLRVLPDSSQEWSNNSKLWVVAVPGAKSVRKFTLSNTSNQRIDVDLKLGGARILDGVISFDKDAKLKSEGYAENNRSCLLSSSWSGIFCRRRVSCCKRCGKRCFLK
jgi:hypothetical protein